MSTGNLGRVGFTSVISQLVMFGLLLGTAAAADLHLPYPPGQILVRPKDRVDERTIQNTFSQHSSKEVGRIDKLNVRVLHVPPDRQPAVLQRLQQDGNIEFAEPDYLVEASATPNDPWFPQQWHLPQISAPTAWDTTVGSSAVTIAILDSGCTVSHPDLAGLIVPGWNFYNNNSDLTDVSGHGSVVAGCAAALSNNGQGVAGVTWNCHLMPLRITDTNGYGLSSAIANALTYAADHGAKVANISYGNVTKISTIITAAQYFQNKGGVVTASAGNDGTFDTTADNAYFLLVSATDQNDLLCTWSTTGNNVDLSAPGYNILSTYYDGASYAWCSGTSFSAPIVAGVAALVYSVNPSLTGAQVQDILKKNSDDLGPAGWDSSYGWGRVNAARAVAAAAGTSDKTAPTATLSAPATGSVLSGTVSVTVSGTDNIGVTKVEWYLDGALKSSSAGASATFSWNTTTTANSSHTLLAKAYDAAGNVGSSASINVTVNNPVPDTTAPTALVSAPAAGATVSGTLTVSVTGSDNVGVTKVE